MLRTVTPDIACMRQFFTSFLFLFFTPLVLLAGGIKGRVLDDDGKPLPYTTIYVKETGSGSISNENGNYEIRLAPGTYHITFQFLGYQSQAIEVEVGETMIVRDIVMLKHAYLLSEAEIKGGKEDPAYKIIRKAIAKSNYHRQQLDAYTCEVYLKGGGRLVDAPRIIRKQLEKEGLDTAATFVTESVSKITYTRPGKYEEEVISIRSTGDNNNTNPMSYINGSFYNPEVAGLVSPLSPKAFAYYKFRYVTTFKDQGYNINKIQVTPRSRGEETVTGMLYIVEDLWAIHSFDFAITVQGINIDARQIFAPVRESVWMPVSHKYDGNGSIFGVKFEFGYLAAVSKYDITINPDLDSEITVLDEKTEKELIESRDSKPTMPAENVDETTRKLLEGEELTRKELRKIIKEYEKDERQKTDQPDVVAERLFSIDSLAHKSDSAYWEEIRPVPLTDREIRGYVVQDSMETEEKRRADGDTLASRDGFSPMGLITGHTFDLGNNNFFKFHSPLPGLNFNTVDGFNQELRVSYFKRLKNKGRFEISPLVRYAFSRDKLSYTMRSEYKYGNEMKSGALKVEGGVYYSQFNSNEPIVPFTNSFSTLFVQKNYFKIYDRDFVEASWRQDITPQVSFTAKTSYAWRRELFNTTDQVWLPSDKRDYVSNEPINYELNNNTGFGYSEAFKVSGAVTYQPGLKFGKRNEYYYRVNNPPKFTMTYERAIPDLFHNRVDYDFVSLQGEYRFDLNLLGTLGINAEGGRFITRDNLDFMDFAHFMGNQTIFTRNGQLNGFFIAPYYDYSTSKEYFRAYTNLELRQFVFTQIPVLRLMGLKENINVNYLATPNTKHYVEVAYSMTNLFRFARIDVVAAFEDGRYADFRIQLGLSSAILNID